MRAASRAQCACRFRAGGLRTCQDAGDRASFPCGIAASEIRDGGERRIHRRSASLRYSVLAGRLQRLTFLHPTDRLSPLIPVCSNQGDQHAKRKVRLARCRLDAAEARAVPPAGLGDRPGPGGGGGMRAVGAIGLQAAATRSRLCPQMGCGPGPLPCAQGRGAGFGLRRFPAPRRRDRGLANAPPGPSELDQPRVNRRGPPTRSLDTVAFGNFVSTAPAASPVPIDRATAVSCFEDTQSLP